jgi:hypothetical protein
VLPQRLELVANHQVVLLPQGVVLVPQVLVVLLHLRPVCCLLLLRLLLLLPLCLHLLCQ